jgi:hypothetical protein
MQGWGNNRKRNEPHHTKAIDGRLISGTHCKMFLSDYVILSLRPGLLIDVEIVTDLWQPEH